MGKRFTAILTLAACLAAGAAEMVKLPGGTFTMGNANGNADEKTRTVTISPFLIDRCEITQAEYAAVTGTNPAKFKGDRLPVECLRWHDAARFCNKRSEREGLKPCYNEETWECDFSADGYRLPTEAEWEYACRAGSADALPKGDLKQYAWMRSNSAEKTHPVGSLKPNAWGLFDMYGNVAEWCNDWYSPDPAGGNDPRGPEKGDKKVLRGGSWKDRPKKISSCRRDKDDPATADICQGYDNYGFRCVRRAKAEAAMTPPPAPPAVVVPPAPEPVGDEGKPLFQSWEFLLFFLPLLVLYAIFRRTKLRVVLILVGSYVF